MEMLNGRPPIHSVSIAATTAFSSSCITRGTIAGPSALNSSPQHPYHQEVDNPKSQNLKHYQLKFITQLQSVAVDSEDILAAARDAGQKLLAKLEAREAAAIAAANREEERVTGLKKIRGERWLPCTTKDINMGLEGHCVLANNAWPNLMLDVIINCFQVHPDVSRRLEIQFLVVHKAWYPR